MKDYASLTDEQLALLYVGGDFRAFDLLLERTANSISGCRALPITSSWTPIVIRRTRI